MTSAPSTSDLVVDSSSVAEGPSSGWARSPRQTIQVSAIVLKIRREGRKVRSFDAIHKLEMEKVERRRGGGLKYSS